MAVARHIGKLSAGCGLAGFLILRRALSAKVPLPSAPLKRVVVSLFAGVGAAAMLIVCLAWAATLTGRRTQDGANLEIDSPPQLEFSPAIMWGLLALSLLTAASAVCRVHRFFRYRDTAGAHAIPPN
jgi:hypothetical protein